MSDFYSVTGRIHSIQSLAASDGPGVRFAVFLQGCPLRCGCCHNPDTWEVDGGKSMTAGEIVEKALRYRTYFGKDGGVTLSGGEPLLQPEIVRAVFTLCKAEGINTCLDTSGCVWNDAVEALLNVTDRVLLDIKYTNEEQYQKHVGCTMEKPLAFLKRMNKKKIPTTLRQVIIPTLNDNEESIRVLKKIAGSHPCVDKVELLPFRKMCQIKYDNMGIDFPFGSLPEPSPDSIKHWEQILAE